MKEVIEKEHKAVMRFEIHMEVTDNNEKCTTNTKSYFSQRSPKIEQENMENNKKNSGTYGCCKKKKQVTEIGEPWAYNGD